MAFAGRKAGSTGERTTIPWATTSSHVISSTETIAVLGRNFWSIAAHSIDGDPAGGRFSGASQNLQRDCQGAYQWGRAVRHRGIDGGGRGTDVGVVAAVRLLWP